MTPARDPQLRVGRIAAGIVVIVLAAALVGQVLRRDDGGAQAAVEPSGGTAALAATEPETRSGSASQEPVYTFVSAPDLLNADIGDISTLPTWSEGMPNSTNPTDEESLSKLFAELGSWDPDAILVAGDEVRGHWDQDGSGLEIFGPVDTPRHKRDAISRAAQFYYPIWKDRFEANGIDYDTVYPAIGDHEIGDNPWPADSFELAAVPLFKRLWADAFTTVDGGPDRFELHPTGTAYDDTAYATYLTDKLILISVDTFAWSPDDLRVSVDDPQLAWLEQVLGEAPDDATILVQGHVPVLTPVRVRGSSNLHLDGGADSAFWQLLETYGVDLYLNGEVHDFTAIQPDGGSTIQVSHGGLFAHGTTSYLVGRVYADGGISLDARTLPDVGDAADHQPLLWQTRNNLQWRVRFADASHSVGTMRIDADHRILERTGQLAPYEPASDAQGPVVSR